MLEDLLQEIDDDVRENTPIVFMEYHLADADSQVEIRVSTTKHHLCHVANAPLGCASPVQDPLAHPGQD